jgi:peptidoglycan/LPS O-acetylase OafA/YrhL
VAILLVLFAHLNFPGGAANPCHPLQYRCGFLGVQVFFVLSGFLITTLMLREIDRTGGLSLRHFYLRRVLRIVPAYVALLVLIAVFQVIGRVQADGRTWLALGTYVVNFLPEHAVPAPAGPMWSLSVEEHFYLLWPFLMAVWPARRCRVAALASIGLALGLRWFLLLAYAPESRPFDTFKATFTRLDDIAAGCLLAFAARDRVWRRRLDVLATQPVLRSLVLGLFLVSLTCFNLAVGERLLGTTGGLLLTGLANTVNAASIAVIMWVVLARPESLCARLLNLPIAVGLGTISYSLYLWHMVFIAPEPAWLCGFPQNVAFILLAGWLSYTLNEKPFLSLKAGLGATRPADGRSREQIGDRNPGVGRGERSDEVAGIEKEPRRVARAVKSRRIGERIAVNL